MVILFLMAQAYPQIIGWDECRGKLGNRQIVPFIECGIRGAISLSDTIEHLRVDEPFYENAKVMAQIYAQIPFARHLSPESPDWGCRR